MEIPWGHREFLALETSEASDTIMVKVLSIPQVTIKTGLTTPEGREELLTEYLCDQPGCPNIATHALGFVREVGAMSAVCDEHAPKARS
jgi:hypothetical protein